MVPFQAVQEKTHGDKETHRTHVRGSAIYLPTPYPPTFPARGGFVISRPDSVSVHQPRLVTLGAGQGSTLHSTAPSLVLRGERQEAAGCDTIKWKGESFKILFCKIVIAAHPGHSNERSR